MAWNLTGDKPLPKQVVMIRNVAGHRINSLWSNDGAICLICIGSDNGLLPIGTKPLPEPMLTFQQRNLPVQFQRMCTALASSNGVGSYALKTHYGDVIMGAIASQITGPTVVYSTVYSIADQRKHQSSASLAFVRGIHRGPVNSPHKWPVTRKVIPFDDVIMSQHTA